MTSTKPALRAWCPTCQAMVPVIRLPHILMCGAWPTRYSIEPHTIADMTQDVLMAPIQEGGKPKE